MHRFIAAVWVYAKFNSIPLARVYFEELCWNGGAWQLGTELRPWVMLASHTIYISDTCACAGSLRTFLCDCQCVWTRAHRHGERGLLAQLLWWCCDIKSHPDINISWEQPSPASFRVVRRQPPLQRRAYFRPDSDACKPHFSILWGVLGPAFFHCDLLFCY